MSRFDQYYRRVSLGLIYRDGWGSVDDLAKIIYYRRNIVGNRDICKQYVPDNYPVRIEKVNFLIKFNTRSNRTIIHEKITCNLGIKI